MLPTEWDAVQAWCKTKALEIRHEAAALGQPVEYAYLKSRPLLEMEARKVFGERSAWSAAEAVENHCYDSELVVTLEEINRRRADFDEPPLDAIPELQLKVQWRVPLPKTPPEYLEQCAAFLVWTKEIVSRAYHSAAARNITPRDALFLLPAHLVSRIMRHFPGLNPAVCLQDLEFGLVAYRPEKLDPARVASIKSWSDIVNEVGDEIASRSKDEKPATLKQ